MHGPAFNALIYGRKVWHLLPPSRDLYSSLHPLTFAEQGGVLSEWYPYRKDPVRISQTGQAGSELEFEGEDTKAKAETYLTGPCEIEQNAGEVLFIPSRWSHTTLNLAESVGFAVELVEG